MLEFLALILSSFTKNHKTTKFTKQREMTDIYVKIFSICAIHMQYILEKLKNVKCKITSKYISIAQNCVQLY